MKLEEPDVATAILILRGLKEKYETAHGVVVRDDAIVAAAELSSRYLAGRQLPDKAVDILDTSAARVKILLTAKPDSVESLERSMQALNREKLALERDRLHGSMIDEERLQQIDTEIMTITDKLTGLMGQWQKEQALAQTLVGLRQRLGDLVGAADATEQRSTLQAEIAQLTENLAELQKDGPLVRIEVDPDVVAKVVSDWTGIPPGRVLRDQAHNVMQLESNLRQRIKGQGRCSAKPYVPLRPA